MATKRTRIDRLRRPQITSRAVYLFIRCKTLWPIWYGCISQSSSCHSDTEGKFCPECLEYEASVARDSLLGIEPWMRGIEDVDTAEPPSDLDRMRVKAWHRVWRLKCALEAEVAKQKVSTRAH